MGDLEPIAPQLGAFCVEMGHHGVMKFNRNEGATAMTAYFAFNTIRRSTAAYTWASRTNAGAIAFHETEAAARRRSWNVERVTIATPQQVKAERDRKAARRAREAEARAEFAARWNAIG